MQLFYTVLKVVSSLRVLVLVHKGVELLQQMLFQVSNFSELVSEKG